MLASVLEVEFRSPWLLLAALTAVPVFWLIHGAGGRLTFSSLAGLPRAAGSWRTKLSWLPAALLAAAAACLAIALAGPRLGDPTSLVKPEGLAIMMVVDASSSMAALDLSEPGRERTRLDAVKEVFRDFVLGGGGLPGRSRDAIGLVTFAKFADTRCPLTVDHDMLAQIASGVDIVTVEREDGTALGDGLGLAVERLRETRAKSKVAIVLTDGVANAGEVAPLAAADLARKSDVRVYTIGAGTTDFAPIRLTDALTGQSFLRGMPVDIDEETLQAMAAKAGGRYFRATDADALRAVYREIDQLERSQLEGIRFLRYRDYYEVWVALALVLVCLGWISRETVFRRLP